MMSCHGVPVEEIARLAGHAITTGAEVMDQIFRPRPAQGTPAGAAG
jgi:hypothetical protein